MKSDGTCCWNPLLALMVKGHGDGTNAVGENFKTLGITLDGALTLADVVAEVVTAAGWKLRTLSRTRRYYCDADLIMLNRSHVLSFLEYRTPAIQPRYT